MAGRQSVAVLWLFQAVAQMPVASAGQPSFDCAKARSWSEVTVCNDAGLADLDQRVAELYRSNRAALTSEQKNSVTRDQRQWLRDRESCKKQADSSGCLVGIYKARIAQLGGEPERHNTSGAGAGAAAGAHDTKAANGSVWGSGLGLSAANALAESGGSVAHKVAPSATDHNAAAGVDPGVDKSITAKGGGHTVPKMRAINLEASTLELPPSRSSDVVDERPVAPASPEEVVSKLRETLGTTSQSEWIATHYEKALLVDKETVHYGPSIRGATYADLEFGIGFSNIYTLDCEKRQFLRTKTIKWSDGWVQDMPLGEKWWPLKPSTTEVNAVYEAICPHLLAPVPGASLRVISKSVENKFFKKERDSAMQDQDSLG